MNKLKIGLLLDNIEIDKYALDLLNWAVRQDGLEVTTVLVRHRAALPPAPRATTLPELLFKIVLAIEGMLIRLFRAHRAHLLAYRLADAAPGCALVRLPLDEHAGVPALGLDLLVYGGTGAPPAGLAGMARLGIVALDYHGQRASRAAPPGFWEAYSKASKTEFEIRHTAPGSASSRVLAAGSFSTKFFFLLNQAHLYSKAGAQLKGLLKTIAATRCLPLEDRSRPYSGPYRLAPRWHQSLAYLGKLGARLAAKAFYRAFNFHEKWGISCVYADWKNAALWNSTRISAPRGHFWADPFLCTHNGKTYCFVEDYVYKSKRGHISVLEITDQGAQPLGDCIREPFHLSFPFLFRYKGELYMCPESSAARQIRIYRCKAFPLEWELCAVAMDNISAADSMLFEHGGRWWLLTNLDRSGLNDHCSELHLFHADSPFAAHWRAHPQNPLRVDAEGGRNAGLIVEDQRLVRAAQRQGFDQYGEGLNLYEIVELNEQRYVERLVFELGCTFRDGLLGSHHMSTTGRITVVDHLDRCFFP
ncbi:glucosamine inositolphosphorylceramide transferase family protein [Massilia horti]|uniref:Glucosamine inositolphosphorylceramide transferase 1 N-terminal domain-containing protein n=1 Tax=Massilia horti TaxID=2562153 RepID=A0A4Y9T8R6_9BURK|nr:hypothetical protein [Massilia horti]TFW34380.1 hypothetical protein E4O92_04030 [Massilia horti]